MKIYVVVGSYVDWEDAGHWNVRGFTDESRAREFRDRCQQISRELSTQWQQEQGALFSGKYPWSEEKNEVRRAFDAKWVRDGVHPLDPNWNRTYDPEYDVEELEVDSV